MYICIFKFKIKNILTIVNKRESRKLVSEVYGAINFFLWFLGLYNLHLLEKSRVNDTGYSTAKERIRQIKLNFHLVLALQLGL